MRGYRTYIALAVLAIVLVIVGWVLLWNPSLRAAANERAARAVVTDFGNALKNVSLQASDASDQIASTYGIYAAKELLAAWQADPAQAPGRLTSSPWPERIDIVSVTPQGKGYVVNANIILKTSADPPEGNAGAVPVVIQVVPVDGEWRIAAYQQKRTE